MKKACFSIAVFLCAVAFAPAQEVKSLPVFVEQGRGDTLTLKIGAATFGPYRGRAGMASISPDGKNYVIPLRKSDTEIVILANGKEYGPYRGDYVVDLQVSGDLNSWIASVVGKTDRDKKITVIANGREFPDVGQVQKDMAGFPSPGFFYFVTWKQEEREQWVITPNARFGPYEKIQEILVAEDKKSLIFLYRNKNGEFLHLKGREFGPYDDSRSVVFARGPKSEKTVGYIMRGRQNSTAFLGGIKLSYEKIEAWYFNPASFQWMVLARNGEKSIVNLNGKETVYEWVDWRQYNQGYLFVAAKPDQAGAVIVLNGREIGGGFRNAWGLQMTPNGSWGVEVEKPKDNGSGIPAVLINGKEYEGSGLRLTFLPDGIQWTWLKYGEENQIFLQILKMKD